MKNFNNTIKIKQPEHLKHAQDFGCLPNKEGLITDPEKLQQTVQDDLKDLEEVFGDLSVEIEILPEKNTDS